MGRAILVSCYYCPDIRLERLKKTKKSSVMIEIRWDPKRVSPKLAYRHAYIYIGLLTYT
jgi:hypothetical protein